jgi:hypothetical protein
MRQPKGTSSDVVEYKKLKELAERFDERESIEVNSHFKVIGYCYRNCKIYYVIYSHLEHRFYSYRSRNFSQIGLNRLAPMHGFWIPRFSGRKGKLNRLAAVNAMIRLADSLGECHGS